MTRLLPLAAVTALALPPAAARSAEPAAKIDFARDVLPILSDNCYACHGPDEKARKADLRLDTKDGVLGGGSVVAGKSAESELIRRLVTDDPAELMPPPKGNKKLTAPQIDTLRRWVDEGAAWGQHWAFVKPVRPPVPDVSGAKAEVRNPIDNFVVARLVREKLAPAPAATKEQLIRRVTLDLTGLPPTPAEVDAFLKDESPAAYETVVDRLLASPRFGERMAWDWLDAARYADSNGYQGDGERTMWPWRDWVVKAFNENTPYDRFTVAQLAGDLLPNPSREQVLATGFSRNHMINGEGGRIAEENRVEYVFDQTEAVGTIWLGLTLTCARCHDHKFDPLTKKDYYQLFAYFNQSPVDGSRGSGQTPPVFDCGTAEQGAKVRSTQAALDETAKTLAPVEARLLVAGAVSAAGTPAATIPAAVSEALGKGPNGRADAAADELAKFYKDRKPEYVKLLAEYRARKQARDGAVAAVPKVMVMQDMPEPRATFQLTRGDYARREAAVQPGVPASLPPLPNDAPKNRRALAEWVVSPDNPLTARVTVNRFWQTFFGTGLVKTADDFGVQGERPSHPELLDWLATEFVASKWDTKHMMRLMVTSATYRQSSKLSPALRERDPENRLLARGPRHRLPSWMIRDQALAASGLLTPTVGGPPVKTYQPAGVWEEATFGFKKYQPDTGAALYRRSLYVFWRRIVGPTMFFDSANRQTCSVKSVVTNTPLHALTTLNDVTYVEAARVLAQRAMLEAKTDDARVAVAFRRVLARPPTPEQSAILLTQLARQRALFAADKDRAAKLLKVGDSPRDESLDAAEHAALTAVCTLILNLDETLTKQ